MTHKISTNTLYLLAGQYINRLLLLGFYVVFARLKNDTVVGEFAIATTYAGFVFIIVSFGIDKFVLREISRQPTVAPIILRVAFRSQLITWLVALPLAVLLPIILGYGLEITYTIGILLVWVLFAAANLTQNATFQGKERMDISSSLDAISAGLLLIFGIAALLLTDSLYALAVAMTLERMVTTAIGVFLNHRYGRGTKQKADNKYSVSAILWASLPFAGFGLLAATYQRIDVLIMPYYVTKSDIGQYATAYRILEATLIVPATIATAAFPTLARTARTDIQAYQYLAGRTLQYSIASVGFMIGVLYVLAPLLISVVFGEEYLFASGLLQILIWGLIFQGINNTLGRCMIAANLEKYFTLVAALALVSNILLNLWLLPLIGTIGAAYATLGSYGISTIMHLAIIKYYDIMPAWHSTAYVAFAWLSAGICVAIFQLFGLVYLSIIPGAVLYIALLFRFKIISIYQLTSLFNYFNPRLRPENPL